MIKWTDEMIEELKNVKDNKELKQFSVLYGMSYNTAKKKFESLQEKEEVIETKKEIKVEKEFENANELKIVPSVILNIDKLIKEGATFYIQESRNQLSKHDKIISDLEHLLEINYDNMTEEECAKISKEIGKNRRQRRCYKNEIELLENNKIDCQNFIKFINIVQEFSSHIDNRLYNVRVLKEELGDKLIVSENNRLIEELKEKAKVSDDIIQRLIELEKNNLKNIRKTMREKGEVVSVDKLDRDWLNKFNTELDKETRNNIIDECYKKYTGVNIKEVRDYTVWSNIIPNYLYEKKYFLRGE